MDALLFAEVDRLLLKTMTNDSRYAQISRAKAAFLCQRVEDNAFHPQQLVLSDRDLHGLSPNRFNYSTIRRFNGGEAIRVHSCVFVVNIRRWLLLTTGE